MLHLGPEAGRELVDLIDQGVDYVVLVQRWALAQVNGNVPAHAVLCIRLFGRNLVVGVAPGVYLPLH